MMLGAFKLLYHKRPIGELQYYLVVEVKDIQTLGRSNNHTAHLFFFFLFEICDFLTAICVAIAVLEVGPELLTFALLSFAEHC